MSKRLGAIRSPMREKVDMSCVACEGTESTERPETVSWPRDLGAMMAAPDHGIPRLVSILTSGEAEALLPDPVPTRPRKGRLTSCTEYEQSVLGLCLTMGPF